ncbi:MAG: right-handed parallel beta-helix repeat-containing protein [Anaerolineae bacterium]
MPMNYYVDAQRGADAHPGSAAQPWRTLARVNQQTFTPGDAVFFRAGCRWEGQLAPKGLGAEGAPIRFDKYGAGALPVIDMGAAYGAAIRLDNQEYWEIRHLELTSGAPAGDAHRQGIRVHVEGAGRIFHHIVVSGCYIHDIWGLLGGHYEGIDSYTSTAILIESPRENTATFDDVLVEGNRIERVDRSGILVWTPTERGSAAHVRVCGNYMHNLGGDAILVLGSIAALVERNTADRTCLRSGDPDVLLAEGDLHYNRSSAAIWLHTCERSVMQFNEVYDSGKMARNNDGMAYDFDFNCIDCILQYNYARHNQGGFLLIMPTTIGNIVRYNISENDARNVMTGGPGLADGNLIYNNTFYRDYGTAQVYGGVVYSNNLFLAAGQGHYQLEMRLVGRWTHNAYGQDWPGGLRPHDSPLDAADCCEAPGTGGRGLDTLEGYRLRPDSPLRTAGVSVENNGGRDFWGDEISPDDRRVGA